MPLTRKGLGRECEPEYCYRVDDRDESPDGRDQVETAIELMRGVVRGVQTLVAESARAAGLRHTDFVALCRLVSVDGLTGVELGRSLGLNASSVTELADRLERTGMVARARSEHDRRVVMLTATVRGRGVVEAALGPVLQEAGEIVAKLGEEQLPVVAAFLGELRSMLDRLGSTPQP